MERFIALLAVDSVAVVVVVMLWRSTHFAGRGNVELVGGLAIA